MSTRHDRMDDPERTFGTQTAAVLRACVTRLPVLAAAGTLVLVAACGGSGSNGPSVAPVAPAAPGGTSPTTPPTTEPPATQPPPTEPPATELPPADPPPTEPPPDVPPPAAATECLNPALYATPGTVIEYQFAVSSGGVDRIATQTQTVEGPSIFNGHAATRIAVAETVPATSSRLSESFQGAYYVTLADQAVRVVGMTSAFDNAGQSVTQALTFSPPQPDLDFSQAAGDSATTASAAIVSYDPPAFAPAGTLTSSAKLVFLGFESVTVPAGTFHNACKFGLDVTTSGTRTVTRWIARGSGVLVRSEANNGDVQRLMSAKIDGAAVTP